MKDSIALPLFILLAIFYAMTCKGRIEVTDTVFSYKTARSIVEDHSLAIDCKREDAGYCLTGADGRSYSKYGSGLAFMLVPYVIAGKIAALVTNLPEDTTTPFLISFFNIFFGAGSCVILFFFTRRLAFSERASLVTAIIFGLATMCWPYSSWDFSEIVQMFCLLAAVYCAVQGGGRPLGSVACLFLSHPYQTL